MEKLTEPKQIAQTVRRFNIAQYNQAEHTPFASGPLTQGIGRQVDRPAAHGLLAGHISNIPNFPPLPETMRLLETLTVNYPTIAPEDFLETSDTEFINTYKFMKGETSSSPSG
jgi:hypothetical protein